MRGVALSGWGLAVSVGLLLCFLRNAWHGQGDSGRVCLRRDARPVSHDGIGRAAPGEECCGEKRLAGECGGGAVCLCGGLSGRRQTGSSPGRFNSSIVCHRRSHESFVFSGYPGRLDGKQGNDGHFAGNPLADCSGFGECGQGRGKAFWEQETEQACSASFSIRLSQPCDCYATSHTGKKGLPRRKDRWPPAHFPLESTSAGDRFRDAGVAYGLRGHDALCGGGSGAAGTVAAAAVHRQG